MRRKPRLLIVGLDGAAYGLMTSWMAAGMLPTFAAFARDAAVAPLRCTWPPHTAHGWPALFSGRLPGHHGIFNFWECQDPEYRLRITPSQAVGCPLLWDVFAENGWTCGLLNIPMSHPAGPWPGYQVTWPLVPTLHYSKPSDLLRELSSVGGHVLPDIACMPDGSAGYPARLKQHIGARTQSVRHLIEHRPTDVIVSVYTEIDRVCHGYWRGLDPGHPQHALTSAADQAAIPEIYTAIDAAFAELLELVGDDCTVMVVSDHGFGPGTRGLRIHHLLSDAGFCTARGQPALDAPANGHQEAAGWGNYLTQLDWEHTSVYMPTPGCYGLNLNLSGRQASGIVSADERPALNAAVSEYLLGLRDPATEGALFEAVVPATTAYAGPYAERAPDLLLVPTDPALMLYHDLDGPTWDTARQNGLHRLEGIWMLRSAQLPREVPQQEIAIEMVAGYLLRSLGLSSPLIPPPDDLQSPRAACAAAGIPPQAWSVERDAAACWPSYQPPLCSDAHDTVSPTAQSSSWIPDTDEEVLKRLQALGYI